MTVLADFLHRHPDTQYLDAMLCDLSCVMRGKRFPIAVADKVFSDGMMLPGSTVLLSVTGESLDPEGLGFSDGDPDQIATPIAGTLTPAPPTDITAPPAAQVLLTMQDLDGAPYYFEPRNVLARVLQRFASLNLKPVVAFELEFYLLDEHKVQPPQTKNGARTNDTQVYGIDQLEDFADYLHEVNQVCAAQNIKCGAMSAEYAPGQFEINLPHSDDPLAVADQCIMFRRVVRAVAKNHCMRGSFMAKPYPESAGSGLHIHVSLLDGNENAFAGTAPFGEPDCVSSTLLNAVGGLQKTLPEATAIFAPNINSYRRFVLDSYVPLQSNWGLENRSVAMRIPKSPPHARRIEHRFAGADANPYLALAAVLAGIEHGISNRLNPDRPATGNTGDAHDPSIPFEIDAALTQCRGAEVLGEYVGADYLRAYCSCKKNEYDAFVKSEQPDTDWYL